MRVVMSQEHGQGQVVGSFWWGRRGSLPKSRWTRRGPSPLRQLLAHVGRARAAMPTPVVEAALTWAFLFVPENPEDSPLCRGGG